MDFSAEVDWEEVWEYQPGCTVELIAKPGVLGTIARYDAMMVPPIWLVDSPRPYYPHELRVVSRPSLSQVFSKGISYFNQASKRKSARKPQVGQSARSQALVRS